MQGEVQRQEKERRVAYESGAEATDILQGDLETRLVSLDFISNSIGSPWRVLNKGSQDGGGGGGGEVGSDSVWLTF